MPFVHANTKNANAVIPADQEVNALYRQLMEECLTSMKEGTLSFEEGFCSMWVAKNLERIGDQSTNIAEDVVFMEKGDDIRHRMESKKRQGESSRFDLFLSQIDKEVLKAPHP